MKGAGGGLYVTLGSVGVTHMFRVPNEAKRRGAHTHNARGEKRPRRATGASATGMVCQDTQTHKGVERGREGGVLFSFFISNYFVCLFSLPPPTAWPQSTTTTMCPSPFAPALLIFNRTRTYPSCQLQPSQAGQPEGMGEEGERRARERGARGGREGLLSPLGPPRCCSALVLLHGGCGCFSCPVAEA